MLAMAVRRVRLKMVVQTGMDWATLRQYSKEQKITNTQVKEYIDIKAGNTKLMRLKFQIQQI